MRLGAKSSTRRAKQSKGKGHGSSRINHQDGLRRSDGLEVEIVCLR